MAHGTRLHLIRRVGGLLLFLFTAVALFSAGAIVVQALAVDPALQASLWGLTGTTVLWVGLALIWGEINPGNDDEPSLAPLLRAGANVLITVDGVVLGLTYALLTPNHPIAPAMKVGALSLVAGVILGLTLYSLVAGNVTTRTAVALCTGLYSLAAWATAFGLLCISFTLIFP